jgi:hypothetical protein
LNDTYKTCVALASICGKACGYSIAVHGSGQRDLDLVALPWVDNVGMTPQELVSYIVQTINLHYGEDVAHATPGSPKSHGRLATIIWVNQLCVDLSVFPPVTEAKEATTGG